MNYETILKRALQVPEKHRKARNKPAKIRHLQKQQRLWMNSKMEWRRSSKQRSAPLFFLKPVRPENAVLLRPVCGTCCPLAA